MKVIRHIGGGLQPKDSLCHIDVSLIAAFQNWCLGVEGLHESWALLSALIRSSVSHAASEPASTKWLKLGANANLSQWSLCCATNRKTDLGMPQAGTCHESHGNRRTKALLRRFEHSALFANQRSYSLIGGCDGTLPSIPLGLTKRRTAMHGEKRCAIA